jgi:hypothetical protein
LKNKNINIIITLYLYLLYISMTTVHEAAKLTVSTESGISRSVTNHLGVLEVSGPGLNYLNSHDHLFQLTSSNVPQLSLGATDNSGIFQLGVDSNGNSILESTHNGQNQNILIQQLGGFVGVGTTTAASTFHIHSTDALIIPVGTTLQRPGEGGGNINASNGMIRYNTTTSEFEGYGPGSSWKSLGAVKDVDGDTYIIPETSPSANNNALQFFTADEERMVINSSGKVGIGTTSPQTGLHVREKIYVTNAGQLATPSTGTYGSVGTRIVLWPGSSSGYPYAIGMTGNTMWFGVPSGQRFSFFGGGSERVRIEADGNVGIGTTSPGSKLTLHGATANAESFVEDLLQLRTTTPHAYSKVGLSWYNTNSSYTMGSIRMEVGPNYNDSDMHFYTAYNKSNTSKMTIEGNGNVGIGTTDPIYKLHVHGSQFAVTYNSDRNYGIYIDMYNTSYGRIQTIRQGVGYNYNLALQPNGGNVGIGTTSPGYRLTVQTGTQYDGIVLRNESSQDLIKLGRESSTRSYIALYNGTSGKVRIDTGGDSYFTGGDVGIGTNNPGAKLHVYGRADFTGTNRTSHINYGTNEHTYIRGGKTDSNVLINDATTTGKVGIGTGTPTVKLHVYGWTTGSRLTAYTQDDGRMAHYSGDNVANNSMTGGQLGPGSWVGYTWSDIDSDNNLVGYMYGGPVWPGALGTYVRYSILSGWNLVIDNGCSLVVSSDERIKLNIEDVPDDYALYQLRNIPCRYYRYKDWRILGKEKTIGFIAQDVAKIMPMAVKIRSCIIPSIYKQLNNAEIMWEEITDSSNNISYKLHCKQELLKLRNFEATIDEDKYYCLDDIDISGILFRFYVNNDLGTNERCYEIVGNEDETFTFSKKWGSVFCYGYEVQDFHSLDKNKLFALNFSATQEIDRIQQEEVSKLAEQTSRIDTLNTKIVNLEDQTSLIDILNTKLVNLEEEVSKLAEQTSQINTLNTKIVNLEQENTLLSKTCNNLSLKMINMQQENQLLRQEIELIKQHIGI